MTEKDYNAVEGVRRSDLWKIHESPEKYKWFMENPQEPTPALIFGTLVHKLLLEPEKFDEEFAVAPSDIDRRTKAGKEAWAAFIEANEEKIIVTAEDLKTASEMVIRVGANPFTRKMLHSEHEKAFFWTDKDTGIPCKVRCDMVVTMGDGRIALADYKTTTDARTDIFVNRDMQRYGYCLQSYMYTEGVKEALGLDYRPDFYFIVQEKKPPYSVNVIAVPGESDVMAYGQDLFRECIGTLSECRKSGYYWGYMGLFGEPNDAYLPGFVRMEDEEE